MLDTVTYSEFRSHISDYVAMIREAGVPLRVKLKDGQNLLVSLEYSEKSSKKPSKNLGKKSNKRKKMDETEYLLASPANARHLMAALKADPSTYKTYTIEEFREKYKI